MMDRREFLTLTGLGLVAALNLPITPARVQTKKEVTGMSYTAKDYAKLIGMEGFSETLLKNHFTLYQGYVTNTNKVLDTLSQMLKDGKAGSYEYAELKRRLGWEFNGMRLHEYYFENLGGKGGITQGGSCSRSWSRISAAMRPGKKILKPPHDAGHRLGGALPGPGRRKTH